jgi:hypothetical protein
MKSAHLAVALFFVTVIGCSEKHTHLAAAFNDQASLPGGLPFQPLQWRVICSGLDKPDSTMSTLYGNDLAVDHARTTISHAYPPGAVLSLVTWSQKEDPHWFGAQIPAQIKSIEFVQIKAGSGASSSQVYEKFEGSPLQEITGTNASARIDSILNERASVMP